jgi:hypothetical protein
MSYTLREIKRAAKESGARVVKQDAVLNGRPLYRIIWADGYNPALFTKSDLERYFFLA